METIFFATWFGAHPPSASTIDSLLYTDLLARDSPTTIIRVVALERFSVPSRKLWRSRPTRRAQAQCSDPLRE